MNEYDGAPLIVDVEQVGRRIGLADGDAITPTQREFITDAILDSQARVEAYLNRELIPVEHTVTGWFPHTSYDLTDVKAWQPQAMQTFDDSARVVSTVANGDGSFDVTFSVGLDAAKERPIVRFIIAEAVLSLRNNPDAQLGERLVQSVSAEGQSISYGTQRYQPREGIAGDAPNLSEIKRYRKRAIYRRARVPQPPWPYGVGGPIPRF